MERQARKVEGRMRVLSRWVGDWEFLVGAKFGLADAAAGSLLCYLKVRYQALPNLLLRNDADVEWQVCFADHRWQAKYPNLKTYSNRLGEGGSFKETVPKPQTIKDKIVWGLLS
jgi:glutathione S-transferase